jgi:O-antigen/teichoic acid export membrane protein
MSLKHEAKKGMIWTFAQQFGTQIVGFGISVILARLLLPEDFGIIALFGVIISIASTLVDGGMVSSVIRTENPTDKDFSTVLIFNVVVSLLMYFIVFYTAPFVAHFIMKDNICYV